MKWPVRLVRIGIIPFNLIMINFLSGQGTANKACVIVPVADLVGQSLHNKEISTTQAYHKMPFCGGSLNPGISCTRLHQLLFNEVVTILKENNDEVLVKVPNVFYVTKADTQTPCTAYWTLKKNIMPLSVLEKKGIDTSALPEPISWSSKNNLSQNIVTLIKPFYDRATKLTFSAGTRFVCTPVVTDDDHKNTISVHILDPRSYHFHRVALPKEICISSKPKSPRDRITLCINLMRSWISNQKSGYIPYVWGGCSFNGTVPSTDFLEKTITLGSTETSYFYLPTSTSYPKSGFDCSGLIVRAAQMVGIPYYFKNTTTIERFLPALTVHDRLTEGDLLIIPGHVMMISDIKNNLLIEARSFIHGYGKVQEIALDKVFLDIHTYADLLAAYFDKKTIYRIDNTGTVRDTIATFKICRLDAVFAAEKAQETGD